MTSLPGNAQLKRVIGDEVATADQKQANSNLPTNFQNLPFVGQRALRQHSAQSLSSIKCVSGERASITSLKKMDSDILFALPFRHPNNR